ncbi:MAG: phosphodiesterase [Boseongicola sp.]|nr:MAG: phosphodiesterase [Boseongicola sp.]
MTNALPASFLDRPIAHRGLHDISEGRPENSFEAARAAIQGGFGIELDVQVSSDGRAMVFHDYELDRVTDETGAFHARSASELSGIRLKGGKEGIPTLEEFLRRVNGQVPVLVEIKDQDFALGPNVGPLEADVARVLAAYRGDVAVMSFNPHSAAEFQKTLPHVPRGLVTESFPEDGWPVPAPVLARLREIPDYERVGACFISHSVHDLDRPRVGELKSKGADILCWTVRSQDQADEALLFADNITFEGYLP